MALQSINHEPNQTMSPKPKKKPTKITVSRCNLMDSNQKTIIQTKPCNQNQRPSQSTILMAIFLAFTKNRIALQKQAISQTIPCNQNLSLSQNYHLCLQH